MTSVEERLQVLEDKQAIHDLLIAYGRALDRLDTKAYSELFAADGEWSGGIGQARTPAGIKKMLDDIFGQSTLRLASPRHVISNMVIEVQGDTGRASSQWMWLVGDKEQNPTIMRAGSYHDELVREKGEWKFQRRRAVTELDRSA